METFYNAPVWQGDHNLYLPGYSTSEEDRLMQWVILSLTAVATVLCFWRWWDLFYVDRADLAEGFPLKQGLKRIMFPGILVSLLLFQSLVLLYVDSRNLVTLGLYSSLPISLAGTQIIRATRNYRRRMAGKPLPVDRNDLVTLNFRK
ncbi:MAG: hypothetical protein OXU26_12670 [Acidobacteriota bacterium]|nr:hypothetical protein [Acidobacteriota bacterium]MDE2964760.1 hypothetical protein [Acidobacteriota bacterium]